MKDKWKLLIINILAPLAVGALSAWISGGGMEAFSEMNQPPLSPPGWVFPVVWTLLYTLMGIAMWLVQTSGAEPAKIKKATTVYVLQLIVNFFWSIIFFGAEAYLFAFFWLLLLWVLIIVTMVRFYDISQTAGELMLPYFLWVTFAGYLTFGVYLLN